MVDEIVDEVMNPDYALAFSRSDRNDGRIV